MRYGGHGTEGNGQSETQMERRANGGKVWGWRQDWGHRDAGRREGDRETDDSVLVAFFLVCVLAHLWGHHFMHIIQGRITSAPNRKKKSEWIWRCVFSSVITLNCWRCFGITAQSFLALPKDVVEICVHQRWVAAQRCLFSTNLSQTFRWRSYKTTGLLSSGHWKRPPHLSTAAGY